ncbi:hypothetical protein GCM10017643_34920 [Ancylobacter dichloromethanicus]|uniref:Uncharacterized protein n=1 Tax=Ancylobacter dichloromethanicus TaxID=518825 RepID=A0A9W6N0S4_9HYPH|nr:hypothetical protein GCM10017643_34920 [Ancylobacter dichloromethanicus]
MAKIAAASRAAIAGISHRFDGRSFKIRPLELYMVASSPIPEEWAGIVFYARSCGRARLTETRRAVFRFRRTLSRSHGRCLFRTGCKTAAPVAARACRPAS